MIDVEKNIPLPPPARGNGEKYPWRSMNVGDSFFIPGASSRKTGAHTNAAGKRTGFKFTSRAVDGGVRIWRVK